MSQNNRKKKRALVLLLTGVFAVALLLVIYAGSYLALRKNQAIVRTTFVVPDPPDLRRGQIPERVIVVDHFVNVPDYSVGDLDNYRRQNKHFPSPRNAVSGLYAPLTWLELRYWHNTMPVGTRLTWPNEKLYYLNAAKQQTKFGGLWDPVRDQ